MTELERQTEEKLGEKRRLAEDAERTETRLRRAEEIVGGLGGVCARPWSRWCGGSRGSESLGGEVNGRGWVVV